MEEISGCTEDQGPFTLEVETDRPIIHTPRRYSPKEKDVIVEKIEEVIRGGIGAEHTGPKACVVNGVIAAKKEAETGLRTKCPAYGSR